MPTLEVRLANSLVESSGSWPARSLARTPRKKTASTTAESATRANITQMLSSVAKMPETSRIRPRADSTAPRVSKGRSGLAGTGSSTRRASHTMTAMTRAWNTKAARQLIAAVIAPPISGPVAAPTPPIALIAPNALAREVTSVKNIVVRM